MAISKRNIGAKGSGLRDTIIKNVYNPSPTAGKKLRNK